MTGSPKKIALEEHYLPPDYLDYWAPSVAGLPPKAIENIQRRLLDFGEERLKSMDDTGIEIAVLSLAGPGVQCEPDTAVATRRAAESNDYLAKRMTEHPNRYRGFAHLAMQDPKGAADELERCVKDLGFCGALINGQTHGHYLDEDMYSVFWERAAALNAPIYLHPADPFRTYHALEGQLQLRRPAWEWTVETGTHALRMIFNGTFERHPGATLVLGHMGETIPYQLWRFDSRAAFNASPTSRKEPPSFYARRNLKVTISGMCDLPPLECALSALGESSVMYAADYPFEEPEAASEFMDNAEIAESTREAVCWSNAAKVFGIE
jgi:2,3-dihydroxybenzoate decarboxylase